MLDNKQASCVVLERGALHNSDVTTIRYTGQRTNTALDDLNSAEFLADLQNGSQPQFDQLVERLLPYLIRFVRQFGEPEITEFDAEEIASDALWAVYQKIQSFRHGGSAKLTTWIFEIAKNRAVDFLRKAASRPERIELSEPLLPHSKVSEHSETSRTQKALMTWLNTELSGLSEDDQSLLKWRALDFSYAEIANWLGMSEGNARVRHKRLIDKLINAGTGVLSKDIKNG